jgi:hypothetical protein
VCSDEEWVLLEMSWVVQYQEDRRHGGDFRNLILQISGDGNTVLSPVEVTLHLSLLPSFLERILPVFLDTISLY